VGTTKGRKKKDHATERGGGRGQKGKGTKQSIKVSVMKGFYFPPLRLDRSLKAKKGRTLGLQRFNANLVFFYISRPEREHSSNKAGSGLGVNKTKRMGVKGKDKALETNPFKKKPTEDSPRQRNFNEEKKKRRLKGGTHRRRDWEGGLR